MGEVRFCSGARSATNRLQGHTDSLHQDLCSIVNHSYDFWQTLRTFYLSTFSAAICAGRLACPSGVIASYRFNLGSIAGGLGSCRIWREPFFSRVLDLGHFPGGQSLSQRTLPGAAPYPL